MDNAFTVTLVRHFPTLGNVHKKYIGWTDEPIMSGLKAVNRLGEAKQVFGSDLLRCRQTAEILFNDVSYIGSAKLRECSFGIWEKKTYKELKDNEKYQTWLEDFYRIAPPEGESLQQLESRVIEGFYDGISQSNPVIIITHGGPIRALLSKFVNSTKSFWEWEVPHGSAYLLHWKDKQEVMEGKHCISFSVEHLMEKELL
ncbi:histidine phosphatase family protein [Psychrobacillus sp. FSL K6-2684]|uniref:Histidine phosphatase family protein n=1 Tax=Psychrobacillus faecigallinarum TaxID=2762235 RepID=A0ABR8R6R1_9BACI|nr:histidine phosphatase family protein [Psychrobacillus faecigallinarum]MBD7943394.1 histidine phosphatase family protein [Psychrobacillus faecigallinarum]QGM31358.1 histidine phosphatase family protein [Bacillus sp. N3536]